MLVLFAPGCPGGQGSTESATSSPVDSTSVYQVEFTTTKGVFVVEVNRDWAPRGADRFRELVTTGYFDDCSFFRIVPGFIVQFGINGDPARTKEWSSKRFSDDPVLESNRAGTLVFATAGPGTRTTQLFINLADNARLDKSGFSPFAKVVSGMDVVKSLYSGYGDGPSQGGSGPDQGRVTSQGATYLDANFPKLDKITKARVLGQ
ncbi:MAG: peptidylprolyl isomerase [Planctomycetes bacterium]|nr:peptidylprolyl isomerase [Planctomycetota bacterium]